MTPPRQRATTPHKGAIIELEEADLKSDVIIHKNLTQDVLLTTEDRMKLALIEYRDTLASRSDWLGAGVLTLSFLSSLLLTTFKDIGPLSAETWRAVYFIFFIMALARFINILIKTYQNRQKSQIDYVINKIKATKPSVSEAEEQEAKKRLRLPRYPF
jgi:hypothetical protein